MDAWAIFRKLTQGGTFDLSKLQNNANKSEVGNDPRRVKKVTKNYNLLSEPSDSEDDINNSTYSQELERKSQKRKFEDDAVKSQTDHVVKSQTDHVVKSQTEHVKSQTDDDSNVTLLNSFNVSRKTPQTKTKKRKLMKFDECKSAELFQEQVNHFRNQNKISVWGTDVPNPISSFTHLKDFHINPKLLSNISSSEYSVPTPIQMQAIPIMLQRRELLACAPTGSGKTAAFLIPIFHHLKEPRKSGFRAVIVAPTRELAHQIYLEACRLSDGLGFRIYIIDKISKAIKKFGPTKFKKLDILVTTPNRLIYLLNQEPPVLNLKSVEWLIVDESDKLFETGATGFRDQLAIIFNSCDSSNIRRAMFSATFAYEVEEWCKLNLDNLVTVSIGIRNTAVNLIEQELLFVGNESGKLIAFRDLVKKGMQPPVLVFVQTKERAKELFNELIYDGINVDVIHADRTQLQRENSVKSFRSGKIWILISTELMGRGIDFKGVNLVINYDFPPSAISYIHRIGRTGRAGRKGKAITFFTEDDAVNIKSIAQIMKDGGYEVPQYMLNLKKPNKKVKRQLAKKASKRDSISTIPQYDLERKEKLKKIINKTKLEKKKQKLQHNMS